MSRIRYIKPAFFEDEKLAECSSFARLLFIGLWCWADREGRLKDRPRVLKNQILGLDDVDITSLLSELEQGGFVVRYAVDNERYICIPGFTEHQRPHKHEPESQIPAPATDIVRTSTDIDAANTGTSATRREGMGTGTGIGMGSVATADERYVLDALLPLLPKSCADAPRQEQRMVQYVHDFPEMDVGAVSDRLVFYQGQLLAGEKKRKDGPYQDIASAFRDMLSRDKKNGHNLKAQHIRPQGNGEPRPIEDRIQPLVMDDRMRSMREAYEREAREREAARKAAG